MKRQTSWIVGALLMAGPGKALAQIDPLAPLASPAPAASPAPLPSPAPLTSPAPSPAPATRSTPVAPPLASSRLAPSPVASAPIRVSVAVDGGWEGYKQTLIARARRDGIGEATIQSTIPALTRDGRVIRLDHGQPGNVLNPNSIPPFAPYRREHVTASLISRGRAHYSANYSRLLSIAARTGVEPSVMMAIYGHETSYGTVVGTFDVVRSLATLAYEGRRREFFEGETIAALRLIDRGTPRGRLKGSYAGATGYPQFMPSVVLRLATDGDGDGRADIWSSEPDALASIGNYLRNAGWRPGVRWGVAVNVPATLDRSAIASRLVAPRCPAVFKRHSRFLTMREWRALGVVPTGPALPEDELATLLEPDGRGASAYLLTGNYRAILDYNCSNFYALAIGLLADSIAR